jgi:Arc/MetJ-type ribon-helix-helix transcriptional regulator
MVVKTTLNFADEDYQKLKKLVDSGRYRTIIDALSDLIRRAD